MLNTARVFLFLLISLFFTLPASAQWWKKKVVERLPLLSDAKNKVFSLDKLPALVPPHITNTVTFERSQYNYDIAEAAIMKSLYHTLRFHLHAEAMGDLNRLVTLYLESRYSEAKWYLLQINYFSRQQNDDFNTIASLVNLGMLKAEIGEFVQAKQDLLDAADFANAKGLLGDVTDIKRKLAIVEQKRVANVKNDVKYAELPPESKN
jgi:hypothetical protein